MRAWLCGAAGVLLAGTAAAAGDSGEGQGAGLSTLLWQALNLALIVGLVVYFARKPASEYLAERRQDIEENLENSARLLADAESRLADWNDRTARLDSELAEIHETSRRVAAEEREEILAQAQATAERIRNDAHAAVDQEVRRARTELAAEAAELAVELAAGLLSEKVNPDDQSRLFDEFLTRIEAGPGGSGDGR